MYFGFDNLWLFFHELGLKEYDPDGCKAGALERAIGIKVIRHSECCFFIFIFWLFYLAYVFLSFMMTFHLPVMYDCR